MKSTVSPDETVLSVKSFYLLTDNLDEAAELSPVASFAAKTAPCTAEAA